MLLCRQAKDRFVRLKKERDYHRMNHRRVLQEKDRLVGDLRRMQEHVSEREDAVGKMKAKYEVGMQAPEGGSVKGGRGQCMTLAGYSAGKDAVGGRSKEEEAGAAGPLCRPGGLTGASAACGSARGLCVIHAGHWPSTSASGAGPSTGQGRGVSGGAGWLPEEQDQASKGGTSTPWSWRGEGGAAQQWEDHGQQGGCCSVCIQRSSVPCCVWSIGCRCVVCAGLAAAGGPGQPLRSPVGATVRPPDQGGRP